LTAVGSAGTGDGTVVSVTGGAVIASAAVGATTVGEAAIGFVGAGAQAPIKIASVKIIVREYKYFIVYYIPFRPFMLMHFLDKTDRHEDKAMNTVPEAQIPP
jgi:hypothetical protein